MVSDVPPVGIAQNERFLSCYAVLLVVQYVVLLIPYNKVNKSSTYIEKKPPKTNGETL
jgi:membrane-anchored glycerophosphoryl diester phosphodiesterase (GDPDase)